MMKIKQETKRQPKNTLAMPLWICLLSNKELFNGSEAISVQGQFK